MQFCLPAIFVVAVKHLYFGAFVLVVFLVLSIKCFRLITFLVSLHEYCSNT